MRGIWFCCVSCSVCQFVCFGHSQWKDTAHFWSARFTAVTECERKWTHWSRRCVALVLSLRPLRYLPSNQSLPTPLPRPPVVLLVLTAGGAAGHICQRLHKSEPSSEAVILISFSSFTPAPPQSSPPPPVFIPPSSATFLQVLSLGLGHYSQIISLINCWLNLFF